MRNDITFKFTPIKNDYIRTSRIIYGQQVSYRVFWGLLLILFIIGLVNLVRLGFTQVPWTIFFLLGPIIIVVFVVFINPFMVGQQVQNNERLRSKTTWHVSNDGIGITTKYSETKFDWGTFHGYFEENEYFIITQSTNKNMFQIVPKRAFRSEDDENTFRKLLEANITMSKQSDQKPFIMRYGKIIFFGVFLLIIIAVVIYNFQQATMMY